MTLCSQYLRNVSKVFKLFPILITILSVWGLCAILTVTEAISPDNGARTDKNIELLYKADWFRFPYPCEYKVQYNDLLSLSYSYSVQWGLPTVSVPGVIGMLAGVLASAIESVGVREIFVVF